MDTVITSAPLTNGAEYKPVAAGPGLGAELLFLDSDREI